MASYKIMGLVCARRKGKRNKAIFDWWKVAWSWKVVKMFSVYVSRIRNKDFTFYGLNSWVKN